MAPWLWWTLAASVIVAVIVAFVTFFVTRAKINKVKNEYMKVAITPEDIEKELQAYDREAHGMLLWEEKNKAIEPLEDEQLEFSINTFVRNKYGTAFILNSKSDYEEKSLAKLANASVVKEPGNFNLIFSGQNVNSDFDQVYKTMKPSEMIVVANAGLKDKEIKRLLRYLKTTGVRHEHQKIGKGIILVVK